ncbi:unnamed protein product [Choristocarpus tenellus]
MGSQAPEAAKCVSDKTSTSNFQLCRPFPPPIIFPLLSQLYISAVSALSSLFIIATYFKFSRLHTFAYKLITMMALANLLLDSAYLMGQARRDATVKCYIQGFSRVYFAVVEFCLITAISLLCYQMIIKHDFSMQERMKTVCIVCWVLPAVFSALPFTTNSYGDAGAWCSITSQDLKSFVWGTFWRFAIIYVPLWISVTVNLFMYSKVMHSMRGLEASMAVYREEDTTEAGSEGGEGLASFSIINRMRMYPVVLIVCWSWATVNRVLEAVDPYGAVYWLYILQYTFQTLQGLLNLVVFVMTPAVIEEWRDQLQKWRIGGFGSSTAVDQAALLAPTPSSSGPIPATGKPESESETEAR